MEARINSEKRFCRQFSVGEIMADSQEFISLALREIKAEITDNLGGDVRAFEKRVIEQVVGPHFAEMEAKTIKWFNGQIDWQIEERALYNPLAYLQEARTLRLIKEYGVFCLKERGRQR